MVNFNKRYFLLALILFLIELIIAIFVKDEIIRPFVGDILVVILIYCFVKIFWRVGTFPLAISVFLFACGVEILQYFKLVNILGVQNNKILVTILGSVFAWTDILAYAIGTCIILWLDSPEKKIVRTYWGIVGLGLLILGVYWHWPTTPVTCESLQRFGARVEGNRCIVSKQVYLSGSIQRLPENLTIQGDFTIAGTQIDTLPAGLVTTGNLYLYKTSISKLPADLQVFGSFSQDLGFGSPGVYCRDIPKTATIKGSRRCF